MDKKIQAQTGLEKHLPPPVEGLDFAVVTFDQLHALLEIPNLNRRIKRDFDIALRLGYSMLMGQNPAYPGQRVGKEFISFILLNPIPADGRSCVSCHSTLTNCSN